LHDDLVMNRRGRAGARISTGIALYVNRGLGTFGFPVRLGVPPEITLLTLRRT
jgi:predicted MPP superfamily phosphohydrolase